MSDFIPSSVVSGALTATLVGNSGDLQIITFTEDRKIIGWQPTLIDASTFGLVDLSIYTQPGAAGDEVATAQFDVGDNVPSTIVIQPAAGYEAVAGTTLYMRFASIGTNAGGLGGLIELESEQSIFAGVDQNLTTAAIVNIYDPATLGMDSGLVDSVVAGVSARMVKYMGRQINEVIGKVEYPDVAPGAGTTLSTQEHPAQNVVVEEGSTTLTEDDDYRVDIEAGVLTRLPVGATWGSRDTKLTYDAGYATVPPALVELATWQCVAELHRLDDRNVGITQRDPEAGATLTFDADGFLPSVTQGMRPWVRVRI